MAKLVPNKVKYNAKKWDKNWEGVDRPQYAIPPPVKHTEEQKELFRRYEAEIKYSNPNLKSFFE